MHNVYYQVRQIYDAIITLIDKEHTLIKAFLEKISIAYYLFYK